MATTGTPSHFMAPELVVDASRPVAPGARIQLAASSCPVCRRVYFPALPSCSACAGQTSDLALPTGATLRGVTAVLHAPPGAEVAVPYHVGVAEFEPGIAIMGLLVEDPEGREPAIGDPLDTIAVAIGDVLTYGFRRRDGNG